MVPPSLVLEYVFFDQGLRERFCEALRGQRVAFELREDDDALIVQVAEDIDDDIEEGLETHYDRLMEEQARLADASDDSADAVHLVGVQYTRVDGQVAVVRMSPAQVNRLTGILSYEELQQLVQQIADAVQENDQRRLCES